MKWGIKQCLPILLGFTFEWKNTFVQGDVSFLDFRGVSDNATDGMFKWNCLWNLQTLFQ